MRLIEHADVEPKPAAVTFATTEHFGLQGARSSTIAEATGRATMYIGAVSGGLVALGLTATAAGVTAAFYAFALILLPTLASVGLATFNRVLLSGIEDLAYANRTARLRGFYFEHAPELVDYLLSVPPAERLRAQGIGGGRWQKFFTAAPWSGSSRPCWPARRLGYWQPSSSTACSSRRTSLASWSPSLCSPR